MSYLIDSDIVAAHLKGRPDETTRLASLQGSLAISIITYGEMYEGIYFGRDPKRYEQGFLAFLRIVDVLPLTKMIMKRFARIRGARRGRPWIPSRKAPLELTMLDWPAWPAGSTFRREDLYGDDGR